MEGSIRIENLDRAGGREAIKPLIVYNGRRPPGTPTIEIEPILVDAVLDQVTGGRISVSEYTLGSQPLDARQEAVNRIEAAFLQLVMTRLWSVESEENSTLLRFATLKELGGAENIVRMHPRPSDGAVLH